MRRQSKTAKRKIRSVKRTKARPDISLQIRSDQESEDFTAGDQIVRLTNLSKVFWPDLGITKRDLLQFYIDLARRYEPPWDGLSCLAFKDGKNIELQSKKGESLSRYFPELIAALGRLKSKNV